MMASFSDTTDSFLISDNLQDQEGAWIIFKQLISNIVSTTCQGVKQFC